MKWLVPNARGVRIIAFIVVILVTSSGRAQSLVRLTTCAEVPASAVNASRHRVAMRTHCNREQAKALAFARAGELAADALASVCRASVSLAEATAACQAHGLTAVTNQPTGGFSGDALAVAGNPTIDFARAIASTSSLRLCVVIRDVFDDAEVTTQDDNICPLDGGRRTIMRLGVRARCGVQCL